MNDEVSRLQMELDLLQQKYRTQLVYMQMLALGLGSESERYWEQYQRFHEAGNKREGGPSEYQRACEILSGNIQGYLRVMARHAKDAGEDSALGPRPGLPGPEDVALHKEIYLVGLWICSVRTSDFPGTWGWHVELAVQDGVVVLRSGEDEFEPIEDAEQILTSMPVDTCGCPVPWPTWPKEEKQEDR